MKLPTDLKSSVMAVRDEAKAKRPAIQAHSFDSALRGLRFAKRALWSGAWRGVRWSSMVRWALTPHRSGKTRPVARVLIIHDFSRQPITVGDLLIARVAAEAVRCAHHAEYADMAFLYEPGIDRHADPDLWNIDSDNLVGTIGKVMQAVQIDPMTGSILLFNAASELERYIEILAPDAVIWPGPSYYSSGQYVYYSVFNELLFEYFRVHRTVPFLSAEPGARHWAESLVERTSHGRRRITVQLRNNQFNPTRNSQLEAWRVFFAAVAEEGDPFVFYLVGDHSEHMKQFSDMPNVVVAKEHFSELSGDLALIAACDAHMGAASGPSTMAIFSNKPYCIFGWRIAEYRYRGLIIEEDIRRMFFATTAQRFIAATETPELLAREWKLIKSALSVTTPAMPATEE